MTRSLKWRMSHAAGGSVATAAIPLGAGCYDWRIVAGAAVAGAVGGLLGVNVAAMAKKMLAKRKAPASE